MRLVGEVGEFHLADPRADARDGQPVLLLQVGQLRQLGVVQRDDVLHGSGAGDIDEPRAVVLEPQGGERGELFDRGFVIGGFVGECAEQDVRCHESVAVFIRKFGSDGFWRGGGGWEAIAAAAVAIQAWSESTGESTGVRSRQSRPLAGACFPGFRGGGSSGILGELMDGYSRGV